ncbi:flavin monoamine oxidase family protein [Corynebacterium sp. S7]
MNNQPHGTTMDVIIVGAGIAGLTAAIVAKQNGLNVLVLEARPRVGGRACSRSVDGGSIDLGATWFWHNEATITSFCEQLGVSTFEQYLAGDALYEAPGQPVQRLQGNPIDAPSSRFAHGAQQLADGLASQLLDDELLLNSAVQAITATPSAVHVHSESTVFEADQVILAIPPALAVEQITFAPELPQDVRDLASQTAVWMGNMAKAVAVYESPFWREAQLAGAAMSYVGPFREIHDHSGPDGSPAALFGFAPAAAVAGRTEAEIAEAFQGQLTRYFGEEAAAPMEIQVIDWSREKYTSPVHVHGQASSQFYGHPLFQQPVHKRIRWASTETASDFGGHLEGAIRAGISAAQAL